ncbi:MAG TPA: tyrosine-type recombinase/integrase [Arsenophonus nasoniae]|uniref:tyrosine-type recombinase/integrase n=1 Tax=Arsenophonus nasoniae TaxID=638 RepID=UPI003879711D
MASSLLTDTKIRGLKPKQSAYYAWQASSSRGTGRLGVKVYPSGRKTFIYRYFINGKAAFITLGDYPALCLSDASLRCKEEAQKLQQGQPITSPYASLKTLFKNYITDQRLRGKRSYEKTDNRLKQVLGSQHINGDTPARDITPEHIKKVLSEFIERGALAGANKVRANLHAVFNFGLFSDNDPAKLGGKILYGITSNPVTVVPSQRGADKALDRFLSWKELRILLETINVPAEACPLNPDYAQLLMLCIFTGGQRPWELMTNTNDNWDKNNSTLTIPPHISKTGDYHVVPLCPTAVRILTEMEQRYPNNAFLFPSDTQEGHLLPSEYAKQLRKFCVREKFAKFTPRDIRRTFKTLAGEMGIRAEMRDRLQNHKRPGVSAKHYDRYDYLREKREIVEQWETKLLSL